MVTITLPSELETAVNEEAAQKGTTLELLAIGVLLERFIRSVSARPLPAGATLADGLGDYIGAINTGDKYPEGSLLSQNTGRRFGELMAEKRKHGGFHSGTGTGTGRH
jgi:hypothetical protein